MVYVRLQYGINEHSRWEQWRNMCFQRKEWNNSAAGYLFLVRSLPRPLLVYTPFHESRSKMLVHIGREMLKLYFMITISDTAVIFFKQVLILCVWWSGYKISEWRQGIMMSKRNLTEKCAVVGVIIFLSFICNCNSLFEIWCTMCV